MSTYVREKVLRIPMDKLDLTEIRAKCAAVDPDYEDDFVYYLEFVFPEMFHYGRRYMFQLAPTESQFIDYVLDYKYDADGEFGKTRALYDSEKEKYLYQFQKLDPNVNMDHVRLVEYCYWNGCEAPDYYDDMNDSFYDEV